jgi:hypothetical protein
MIRFNTGTGKFSDGLGLFILQMAFDALQWKMSVPLLDINA